jgi:hypothetical protein
MRPRFAPVVLAVMLAAGCARSADVDAISPGTDVIVKQTNGVSVAGKLVEVTPNNIIVDEKNGGRRAMERREVTSVALAEIPLAPQPNAASEEAAERARSGAQPTVPSPTSNTPSDHTETAAAGTSGAAKGAVVDAPTFREITVPAGTTVSVRMDSSVGSDTSRVEDAVRGTVTRGVNVGGANVIPPGSQVIGSVTSAVRPGKVKGRSYVAMRFHTLVAHDDKYSIRTGAVARRGRATKKQDAAKIGIPAAGGAVIGGIVGGKKGAAIGGAAGGGAGTAVVLSTRGEDVHIARGSVVTVRLTEPVRIRIATR